MERKAAKELLHIQAGSTASTRSSSGARTAYLADDLMQEAGDSLTMKLGEGANRLSRFASSCRRASTGRLRSRIGT